jgi:hypothetical protein
MEKKSIYIKYHANDLQIGAVGDFKNELFGITEHLIRSRMFDKPLKPLLLPMCCYRLPLSNDY